MKPSEIAPPNGKVTLGLLKDHLELASLEFGYEKQEGSRRLLILTVSGLLLVSSFAFFQLALISWFLRRGWSWGEIGLVFGFFYFISGMAILWFFGGRQKGLGQPFQGSLNELKRSFNWIEKRFF